MILVDQHRHPYRDAQDALNGINRGGAAAVSSAGCRRALATAPVAPPLRSPAGRRARQSPTARCPHCRDATMTRRDMPGSGAAPAQRRVLRPAPAGVDAGWWPWPGCPALLTAAPRRRRGAGGCLSAAGAPGSLHRCRAAAPTVPAGAAAIHLSFARADLQFLFRAAALALPPCHAFCGSSAPAGAPLLPRRRSSAIWLPQCSPCTHPHFATNRPHLIS